MVGVVAAVVAQPMLALQFKFLQSIRQEIHLLTMYVLEHL
jgi:hypothetical protein